MPEKGGAELVVALERAVKGFDGTARAIGAGGADLTPAKRRFRIPRPPHTKIARVKISAKNGKAKFNFNAIGGKATGFECELRRPHAKRKPRFKRCRSPKTYRHLKTGRHTFKVQAKSSLRALDPTPAKRKFRIRR